MRQIRENEKRKNSLCAKPRAKQIVRFYRNGEELHQFLSNLLTKERKKKIKSIFLQVETKTTQTTNLRCFLFQSF